MVHINMEKFILCRLGAIAADSELQEKSMSELQQLMTVLHEGCVQAEEEHRARSEHAHNLSLATSSFTRSCVVSCALVCLFESLQN